MAGITLLFLAALAPTVAPASPISKYSVASAVIVHEGRHASTELDIPGGAATVSAYAGPGTLTYLNESRQLIVVTAPFVCIRLWYSEDGNDPGRSDFGCGRADVHVARDLSAATASGVISSDAYFNHGYGTFPTHTPSSLTFSVTWHATSPCAFERISICDPLDILSTSSRVGTAEGRVYSNALAIDVTDNKDWSYLHGYCCTAEYMTSLDWEVEQEIWNGPSG